MVSLLLHIDISVEKYRYYRYIIVLCRDFFGTVKSELRTLKKGVLRNSVKFWTIYIPRRQQVMHNTEVDDKTFISGGGCSKLTSFCTILNSLGERKIERVRERGIIFRAELFRRFCRKGEKSGQTEISLNFSLIFKNFLLEFPASHICSNFPQISSHFFQIPLKFLSNMKIITMYIRRIINNDIIGSVLVPSPSTSAFFPLIANGN